MVFYWSLSDSKSPQVSRTRLSILAVLSNAVVWIVSTRPPTSKSSRPFNNPLVTVPNAPITIGTIVTFIFHSFFNSLARSRYLSFLSHSFRFYYYYYIILYYIILYYYSKISRSVERFAFFEFIYFVLTYALYIWVCFQLVAFVREPVWHKAFWMGYSMRLDTLLFPV